MRLCVLSTSYPRSSSDDAGIFVQRLVQSLEQHGCKGIIVVPLDASEPRIEQHGAFSLCRFRYGIICRGSLAFGAGILPNVRKNPLRLLQAPALLFQMVRSAFRYRDSFDVIQANWVVSGLAAWVISLLSGKAFVLTVRGEDAKLLRHRALRWLFWPMLKRAHAVVTVNEGFRSLLVSELQLASNKVHYIPNGVDVPRVNSRELERFCAAHRIERSMGQLLYIGRIIPLKRVEKLIQLLACKELDSFGLLVCGGCEDADYEKSLRAMAKELALQARITFLGRIAPHEVPYVLAAARIYVSASSYEGRSNSVLEALAAGLVVAVSDIAGHREIVQDGSNGILVDFDNVSEASRRIAAVLSDSAIENGLKSAAQETTKALTWSNTARKYSQLFEQCLL